MPAKVEIQATFYKFRRNMRWPNGENEGDTIIADGETEIDGVVTNIGLKGQDEGELYPHAQYRFYGYWDTYQNRRSGESEKQFVFSSYVLANPHAEEAIRKYIERAPSIGKVFARELYKAFGQDAVRMLREEPAKAAAAVKRLTESAAEEAATWLATQEHVEHVTIDLIGMFDGKGFPRDLAKKCIRKWGSQAAAFVRQDAFRLMAFRGCGFKLCDTLYLSLGGNPSSLKRQALCIWYGIRNATSSGDTWHFAKVAEQALKSSVSGTKVRFEAALRLAFRADLMARIWTDGLNGDPAWDGDTPWVADFQKAQNEWELAQHVARAMREAQL